MMNKSQAIGVIGATSIVGQLLVRKLISSNLLVYAFSRNRDEGIVDNVNWRNLNNYSLNIDNDTPIMLWICFAPIWTLPEHFPLLESYRAHRIVVLSSTSCFTKVDSSDKHEQEIVRQLVSAEKSLQQWAIENQVEWIILRPTLIYGHGSDKNITEISHFIRRFGFFPLFGKAKGLRQPVYADDVADACVKSLLTPNVLNKAYNLSGDEVITYREMVSRIFTRLGRKERFIYIPIWVFRLVLTIIRMIPRYRSWTITMVERMNKNMIFDHTNAAQDFDYKPRPFILSEDDIPK